MFQVRKITLVPPLFVTPSRSAVDKEGTSGEDQVKSMLQAIASHAGIEIDFEEESSYSDDSEYENEEEEEEEGEGENREGEEGEREGQGKEGGEEVEGEKEEGKKEGDGASGGETKRGESNSERGNGEEERAEEEEENGTATVNCGIDESQSRKISSEHLKGGQCSNTKTSLTSSKQVSESPKPTAPLCENPSSVTVNGVLNENTEEDGHPRVKSEGQCERGSTDGKGPCGKNSTSDCKSPCDKDSSSRAKTTQSSTEDGRFSRNRTLLGLLTSTISRPQNHRVSFTMWNIYCLLVYILPPELRTPH